MLKLAQTGQEGDKTCQGPHDHSGQAKGRQNEKPPRHGEAIMFVVRGLAFLCMGMVWRRCRNVELTSSRPQAMRIYATCIYPKHSTCTLDTLG